MSRNEKEREIEKMHEAIGDYARELNQAIAARGHGRRSSVKASTTGVGAAGETTGAMLIWGVLLLPKPRCSKLYSIKDTPHDSIHPYTTFDHTWRWATKFFSGRV